MECVNCGKLGHTFRDCRAPVMSFGIAAVKFCDDNPYYLLIRRRDSMSYVEFLRGKYKLDNVAYIRLLLSSMSTEEQGRLLTIPFDTLWENLWNGQNTRQFRNEYESAKKNFESIKNTGDVYGCLLAQYIESSPSVWSEPEWGFPKGRRTLHEAELSCALREFSEETGFPKNVLHMVSGEPPIVEEYVGTNGVPYKQVYFIGACDPDTVAALQPHNRVMSREVGDIGWFPFEVAYTKIRETNKEKRAMLGCLHHRIMSEDLGTRLKNALEWTET